MDLTDAQWVVLAPTFRPHRRADGRGRPWTNARAVMNGVLRVLCTGAPWHDLATRWPPHQTCHRHFQQWQRSGRPDRLLQRLAEDLRDRGKIDLSEAFVDATFAGTKKGGPPLGPYSPRQREQNHATCDRHGLPVAVHLASASPHEPHLLPTTLDARFVPNLPTRLIGDCGYDTDALDAIMMARLRDRNDRAASTRPPRADPGWPPAPTHHPALEDRTPLRLAPQRAAAGHAV
jgi:transposase